jgi:AcrR family transcriptional regulator
LSPTLSGALEAFDEHGYHGTSVRDIARRVGVTVPALYYHHENKEAILFALLDSSIERLHALCAEALTDAGDDPELRYLNLVECLVRYMMNSGKIAHLDAEFRSLSPELRAVYSAKRYAIEMMLLGAIEDGVQAGIFDVTSPRDSARAILGMIQAVATWYRPDGRLAVDAIALRYLDICALAVGATSEVVRRVRRRTG